MPTATWASRDARRSSPARLLASPGAADRFTLVRSRRRGDCEGRGAGLSRGRGQLRDCGDNTASERLGLSGAMLWFQGAIPAAIASAKRSGAVFVVFVAGEGGGGQGPSYGRDTLSGLPSTSGVPSLSEHQQARAARPCLFSASPVLLGHSGPGLRCQLSLGPKL